MRTSKVNFITLVKNNFTRAGRAANVELMEMYAENPKVVAYQKGLSNGKIALKCRSARSQSGVKDNLLIFSKNGLDATKETIISRLDSSIHKHVYSSILSIKNLYNIFGEALLTTKKVILYNLTNRKVEESATKITNLSGASKLKVYSAGSRTTQFPSTRLAGSLHPQIAEKHIDKLSGDVYYVETHMHR